MENNKYVFSKLPKLVDKIVTVSLDNKNDEFNDMVKSLQSHAHKNTCLCYNRCRFGYPRFPSEETIIASPLPDNISMEEQEKTIAKAKSILSEVSKALEINENRIKEGLFDKVTIQEFIQNLDIDYQDYKEA